MVLLEPDPRPRFRLVGGLILAEPIDYWRQGGPYPERDEADPRRVVQSLARIPVFVEGEGPGEVVEIPVIGGNSVFGIMKNSIPEYMFEYYRLNDPGKLKLIYYESPESVIMAALFRMKPPFVPVKRPSPQLYEAVWENFIWRAWGIGLAPWAPQKPFSTTSLIPMFAAGPARLEVVRFIARLAGVDVVDRVPRIPAAEKVVNTIIKLRHPLTADYPRAGVRPAPEDVTYKWLKEKGFIKSEKKRKGGSSEEWTFLEPVPIKMMVAPANTPLTSVMVQKNAMKLFTDMEVASIAFAIRNLCIVGPKENTFVLRVAAVFKDVYSGEKAVMKKTSYGVCGLNAEESEELTRYSSKFEEWVKNTDYPSYIHRTGKLLIEAVEKEKR